MAEAISDERALELARGNIAAASKLMVCVCVCVQALLCLSHPLPCDAASALPTAATTQLPPLLLSHWRPHCDARPAVMRVT